MAKRKKKGKLTIIITLLVLVIVVVGIVVVAGKQKPKGTEVTIGTSETGSITSLVTATGKIYPEVEVKISSEVAGEIIELPVYDGMEVKKGDLLVKVNPDTLEAQVKQQEAALSASKANAAQAKAQMLKAELDLKRTQQLFEKGFATQDGLDQAQTSVEVAQASHESSVFRIQQQQMQLKEATDELAKASTYAPISGRITALNSELGDRVVGTGQFAGTEIMRLADLSSMEVRVEVSEAEIVEITVGDKASIEIDAIPDEVFKGEVTEIANSAQTSQTGSREELTTFLVKVRLEEEDIRFRPGMTATADIETETVSDIVMVPLQAVTVRQKSEVKKQLGLESDEEDEQSDDTEEKGSGEKDGKDDAKARRDRLQRVVFVVEDGKAILTPVETGLADNRNLEITSGLEADQKIVTGSYGVLTRQLKHDMAVIEKNPENFLTSNATLHQ
jgi:HlyD family secretion protein